MNYAPYEKLNLDEIYNQNENKSEKHSDCFYNERIMKLNSKKCNSPDYNKKQSDYLLKNNDKRKCKLIYNNRINNNLVSNKNNKQLNTRLINTIPYKNPKIFEYNPEYELIVQSGLYTGNRKSTSNTGEIKQDLPPMIKSLKAKIKNKSDNFDISRFQLSSRNLKGNKYYMKKYVKNLNLIKSSLNKN